MQERMTLQEDRQETQFDLSVYKELYLDQARQCLMTLVRSMATLEDDPADRAALHVAHRAAHTLKGMSATMHYQALTSLARALEAPFYRAVQEALTLTPAQIETLREGCRDFETGLDRLDLE
jgi:two-component system, chemotaxis family, sensor kinase CheA